MQKCLLFALIVLFASFNAQAQDCPRIYTKGDTLYTDPAAQYQWYKDNQAISGASKQWYVPSNKGSYAVEISAITEKFPYCQLLDSAALAQKPEYKSMEAAINAQEVVLKLILLAGKINSNDLMVIVDRFPCLQELDLWENQLTNLPESFGQLRNLQTLSLAFNQLTNLPESFGQLQNLKFLSLRNNQLTSLSESIGQLQNLNTLYISDNKLIKLPESFNQMRNLETLDLLDNQLTGLPESFGQLQNLKTLILLNNQLTSLPESFGQLQNLKFLNIVNNRLTSIPASIANLKDNLKTLYLNDNPIPEEEKAKIRSWLPNTTIIF